MQVAAAVEWPKDPGRPEGIVVSQREIIVRHVADGRLQRIRQTALHGQINAAVLILVDIAPGCSGEMPNSSEQELLDHLASSSAA